MKHDYKVSFSSEKMTLIPEFGTSNVTFYGWFNVDGYRMGTVWRFKDSGDYIANEDFNRRIHSKEKRPRQFKASTLKMLKEVIRVEW